MSAPWEEYQDGPWSEYAAKDAVAEPRTAADSGEALLTNLPAKGFGQEIVRGLPGAAGAMAGAAAGAFAAAPFAPLAGPLAPAVPIIGAVGGAFFGGTAGEASRLAVAQGTAAAFPEQNYPQIGFGDAARRAVTAGAVNAAGEGFGRGVVMGAQALRPAFNRGGAAAMKVAANIPERSGQFALEDMTRLGRAPSDATVSGLYDDFHRASGTVSREDAIARSADPFDTPQRAYESMRDAYLKLRQGTLTMQEAVEASQAGRIIRDAKSRGTEFAQNISQTADRLKGAFDDFISQGMGPRTEMRTIPVAQEITRESTPVASRLTQKSDVFENARMLVPEQVNVPVEASRDILPDLQRVTEVTRRAKANGLVPRSIMTDSERALFDQFQTAIESAADNNVPIQTLLTSGERTAPVAGFAEKTVLRPGEPIYAGANRYEFGGTVDKVSYRPGDEIMGQWPVQTAPQPGYPEWQAARQGAFENAVASDFGSLFPRNVNGQPNLLGAKWAIGSGMTTGAAAGAALGGPVGALVGGGIGAVGGLLTASPMAYGAAIRAAGAVSRVPGAIPAAIYRVGTSGAAPSLADYYLRARNP